MKKQSRKYFAWCSRDGIALAASFCALLLPALAAAETYGEWLETQPMSPGAAVWFDKSFKDGGNPVELPVSAVPAIRMSQTEVPTRPVSGYLGELTVDAGITDPQFFPLKARLLFSTLDGADNEAERSFDLQQDVHEPSRTMEYEISPGAGRVSFPLTLPMIQETRGFSVTNRVACRLEILSNKGKVLGRWLLIDEMHAQYTSSTSWVSNDPEADRALRELAGIENAETIRRLPKAMAAYIQLDGLWVSKELLGSGQLSTELLRRLLLMGVWMYGHADTAQSLADIAGLPGPKSLFFGGIGNNTSVSPRLLYRTRGLGSVSSIGQTTSYYPDEHAPDSYVLSFRHLFTSYRKAYLSWTILSLSLFSLMIVIGAPLCFICLRGEQRLKTWWLLPAATVGFGLVIWFGGLAVLPRKPLLRIGEFRLGYGSWPEVLVIDALESLTFERETLNVASTSKDSVLNEEFTVSAASREIRKLSGVTPEYQLHWSTRERGSTESKQLIHFVNTPKPLSLVNEGNGKIKVRAMQDLKQLFILYKHEWHVFGSTKAGTSIDPRAGNTFGSIDGLPAQLQALLNLSSGDQFNDPYYRSVPENGDPALIQQSIDLQKSLKEKGLYPDDVIAVTVTTEAPVVRQVEEKADVIFEVVWVLQLPRAEAESTSSSTVSETANSASLNGTAIHSITPNNTIFSSALSSSALSSSAGAGS